MSEPSARKDGVWKSESLTQTFVEGVRGGIPFAAEQIETMLRVIRARGERVERFADLGCGSGVLAQALGSEYPQAAGVLVDFSEPMLRRAQAQLGPSRPDWRFVLADLAAPAWLAQIPHEAPFDVVVSGFAIHHLPDPRKAELYQEIFDLLAPGGMFVNIEHVASASPWIEHISDDLMVDSLHDFHTIQGAGKTRAQVAHEFVHRPDKSANILAPVELQCAWLRNIGFEDVDCYFKVFELAVFGGRRA